MNRTWGLYKLENKSICMHCTYMYILYRLTYLDDIFIKHTLNPPPNVYLYEYGLSTTDFSDKARTDIWRVTVKEDVNAHHYNFFNHQNKIFGHRHHSKIFVNNHHNILLIRIIIKPSLIMIILTPPWIIIIIISLLIIIIIASF